MLSLRHILPFSKCMGMAPTTGNVQASWEMLLHNCPIIVIINRDRCLLLIIKTSSLLFLLPCCVLFSFLLFFILFLIHFFWLAEWFPFPQCHRNITVLKLNMNVLSVVLSLIPHALQQSALVILPGERWLQAGRPRLARAQLRNICLSQLPQIS